MRTALIALAALLPAACAHHHDRLHDAVRGSAAVVQVERVEEVAGTRAAEPVAAPLRRPDAAYARMPRYGKRTMASDGMVEVPIDDRGGLDYASLFRFVSEQTGVRIRYEETSAVVKSKKVTAVGPTRVAKDDLIAWFQDACAYDQLIAVAYGPPDRREYAVMDMANAALTQHPQSVHENELPPLAGRSGLYVSAMLTLPDGVDGARVRTALSQMSTRTAGLGRVSDVGDAGVVIVSDFANIVSAMRRTLDEMAIARYEQSQR